MSLALEAVYLEGYCKDADDGHWTYCDNDMPDGYVVYVRSIPIGGEFDCFHEQEFDQLNAALNTARALAAQYDLEIIQG